MRWIVALGFLLAVGGWGQTTQGLVYGTIRDEDAHRPIAGATITYESATLPVRGTVRSASDGAYRLPPLPPGSFHLRVEARGYRPGDLYNLEVRVAGRLILDFSLQDLRDVWGDARFRGLWMPGREYLATLYGPDLQAQSTVVTPSSGEQGAPDAAVSQSIDPAQIRDLPLAGRDVYTVLVTQAGITAEAATTRSLGVAANGQRPSASQFLLDGLDLNNMLLSGPAVVPAPEVVQEYRVAIADFSAETGGTSGYTANAITRAGGNAVHGLAYFNLGNEALGANSLQNNRLGLRRPVARETRPGLQVGGPLWKPILFASASVEQLHTHGHAPATELSVPAPLLTDITFAGSDARKLLTAYSTPAAQTGLELTHRLWFEPPTTTDRTLGLLRLDLVPSRARHRAAARAAVHAARQPDFVWSPYPDFQAALRQDVANGALTLSSLWSPRLVSELRGGFTADNLGWDRPHPEIPTLVDTSPEMTILPGSLAFYEFSNRIRALQLQGGVTWSPRRHSLKLGAGLMRRTLGGYLSAGRDGRYAFPTVVDFAVDQPQYFSVAVDRRQLPDLALPDPSRRYSVNDSYAFVQESFQWTPRVTIQAGGRWERFGSPRNSGAVSDLTVELGAGAGWIEQLRNATLNPQTRSLFQQPSSILSLRAGAALALTANGATVLRAGWGQFRDRPFDNLWLNLRNNGFALMNFEYNPAAGSYLQPVRSVLPNYTGQPLSADFPYLTAFDTGWASGASESRFAGLQHRWDNWTLDAAYLASTGRRLASTDVINRPFTLRPDATSPDGSANPALPQISYRANRASSSYNGLAISASYRGERGQLHLAYTWGHSIDNQSDPIAGDFFDLNFTAVTSAASSRQIAAFTRQFDPAPDRGNSDFDQRQSLVFYSLWTLPEWHPAGPLLRNWQLAQLGAIRSGFPYTIYTASSVPESGGVTYNTRADLIHPAAARLSLPAAGGRQLLNASAFAAPEGGRVGTSGRNAFASPGFFSLDLSLSRSAGLPFLGDSGRLILRADAFNLLNHANLNRPGALLGSSTFGHADFGRTGLDTGFPVSTPFRETARQVQLLLRVVF